MKMATEKLKKMLKPGEVFELGFSGSGISPTLAVLLSIEESHLEEGERAIVAKLEDYASGRVSGGFPQSTPEGYHLQDQDIGEEYQTLYPGIPLLPKKLQIKGIVCRQHEFHDRFPVHSKDSAQDREYLEKAFQKFQEAQ